MPNSGDGKRTRISSKNSVVKCKWADDQRGSLIGTYSIDLPGFLPFRYYIHVYLCSTRIWELDIYLHVVL